MSEWNILSDHVKTKNEWISQLKTLCRNLEVNTSNLVFADAGSSGWKDELQHVQRESVSVILVVQDHDFFPKPQDLALVDDILVYPFRQAELLSKFRAHSERMVHRMGQEEMKLAQEDLQQANGVLERILQAKTPRMYGGLKGVNIMSRHLSGLKPGGDYFDVFESQDKSVVNILLADCSSYGVSSALLGMILSSSAKIASDAQMNTGDWIRAIYQELKTSLGENEHLSLFFGRLHRRDSSLHYQLYGTIEAYTVEKSGEVHPLEKHGRRINAVSEPEHGFENVIHLDPKDRIILLSDGFVNGVGGEFSLQKIFHDKLERDPFELINELTYQIKSKLVPGETFPGEDCSALVIDVEGRVLRLAPTG